MIVPAPAMHLPGATHAVSAASAGTGELSSSSGPSLAVSAATAGPICRRVTLEETSHSSNERPTAPGIKRARKASMREALSAAETPVDKQAALNELEHDKVANSARASKNSTWLTWQPMHHAWFGVGVPPLPLTAEKIRAVAAMFKAGHYASFSNYACRAKVEHIVRADTHLAPWTEELAFELRAAQRSVSRGVGPSKQSYPLDVAKVSRLEPGDGPLVEDGPIGVLDVVTVGTFFLARELELACAKVGHFHFDVEAQEVTWNLPASKNDVEALGTYRTWGCICNAAVGIGCPYHAALRQRARARDCCERMDGELPTFPFFPTAGVGIASKASMVATIEELVRRCGLPTRDALDRPMYGGHSLRTGGAVLLASLGLDSTRIEAMARWKSPMLLYYIRSSPLKSITREVCRLLAAGGGNPTSDSPGPATRHAVSAASQCSDSLVRAVGNLSSRLDEALAAMSEREQRIAALEAITAPSQFIRNATSGMWHVSREHRAGCVCYTACGWTYTGAHFEAAPDMPSTVPHKLICGTCLPTLRCNAKATVAIVVATKLDQSECDLDTLSCIDHVALSQQLSMKNIAWVGRLRDQDA